jgi:hypothetical protein
VRIPVFGWKISIQERKISVIVGKEKAPDFVVKPEAVF